MKKEFIAEGTTCESCAEIIKTSKNRGISIYK